MWLAPCAVARAEDDTSAPIITPVVPGDMRAGKVTLRARITDQSGIFEPRLYWRFVGTTDYERVKLEPVGAGYVATIEVDRDFEYWMDAYDELGNGPATAGSADNPRLVTVSTPAARRAEEDRYSTFRATPEPTAPSAEPAPPPEPVRVPQPAKPPDPPPPPRPIAQEPPTVLTATPLPPRRDDGKSALAFERKSAGSRPAPSETIDAPARRMFEQGPDVEPAPKPARVVPLISPVEPVDRPARPPPPEPPPLPIARTLRVATAGRLVPDRLEVLLDLGFISGDDFLLPAAKTRGGMGGIRASYVLHPLVELSGQASFLAAQVAVLGVNPIWVGSLGDLGLAARVISPELAGFVRAGAVLAADLPSPNLSAFALAVSPSLTGVVSIRQPIFRLHANLGYRWDNSENVLAGQWGVATPFGLGVSRYDQLRFGAAVEMVIGAVFPFIEYTAELPVNRRAWASCDGGASCLPSPAAFPAVAGATPQRLGAGLRFEVGGDFALVLGAELSLTAAGRSLSDASVRSLPAPDAYPIPAPLAARVQFVWQGGGTVEKEPPPADLFRGSRVAVPIDLDEPEPPAPATSDVVEAVPASLPFSPEAPDLSLVPADPPESRP